MELYGMSFCEGKTIIMSSRNLSTVKSNIGFVDMYDQHIEYVKRVVPEHRLHFVDLKQGWTPFCDILGIPVPQVPFPHLNDAVAADKIFKGVVLKAVGLWILIVALGAWVVYIGMGALMW